MICLALYCGFHVQNGNSMSLWPLDLLSVLGLIEVALVVGAALYCFGAAQSLERARYISSLRNNIKDRCGLLDIAWSEARSDAVKQMRVPALEELWHNFKCERKWPGDEAAEQANAGDAEAG
jgi:hypothetical protein